MGSGIKIIIKVASNSVTMSKCSYHSRNSMLSLVPSPSRRQRSNAGSHLPFAQQVADLSQNTARVLQYIENNEYRANPNPPLREEEGLQNDLQDALQDNNNSSQRVR